MAGAGRQARVRVPGKSFEPGGILSSMARPRSRRARIAGARPPLAGGTHQFGRPGLGIQLGGLVGSARSRAKKSWRNLQAGGTVEKPSLTREEFGGFRAGQKFVLATTASVN